MFLCIALVVLAYLAGSLSSAILVCRARGLDDPRKGGSGNPGATNVLRLHGKGMAAAVMLGDAAKGAAPVLLARWLDCPELHIALVGQGAFLGHLYPAFFGLRGGKGVATLVGVLLASHWLLGLAFLGTWLAVLLLSRYASLASLIAAALTPLYAWWLLAGWLWPCSYGLMATWLCWRHRGNIRRLLAGEEAKSHLLGGGKRAK